MTATVSAIASWLESYGGFGLFLAAALDAFVPLAQVVDPMVVLLSYKSGNPVLYATLAIAGSTLGNTLLFLLVRRGGEGFVNRRLKPETRERLTRFVRNNGLVSVLAGATLPPPFPLKGVVLAAGLVRMPLLLFAGGMVTARVVRYGTEAVLAAFYGEAVLTFMKQRYPEIGLATAAVLIGLWLVYRRWLRAEPAAAE